MDENKVEAPVEPVEDVSETTPAPAAPVVDEGESETADEEAAEVEPEGA